jgi:hypothetical protein
MIGYLNVIPSPGAHGPSTSPSIPSEDLMQRSGSTSNFSEELSWPANMKIMTEHASLCQTVLANLPLDNPWTNIIRWFKICIIGSLVAGRYGHAMEVVKLPGVRHQFLTQCFLEALSRSGMSYEDCKSVDCEYLCTPCMMRAHGPMIFPVELGSGIRFHWHHLREQAIRLSFIF